MNESTFFTGDNHEKNPVKTMKDRIYSGKKPRTGPVRAFSPKKFFKEGSFSKNSHRKRQTGEMPLQIPEKNNTMTVIA